jgi:hypothetical protein
MTDALAPWSNGVVGLGDNYERAQAGTLFAIVLGSSRGIRPSPQETAA